MVRDHASRRPAAVCNMYYREGVNFKLWTPQLTSLVHVVLSCAGKAASLGEICCSF